MTTNNEHSSLRITCLNFWHKSISTIINFINLILFKYRVYTEVTEYDLAEARHATISLHHQFKSNNKLTYRHPKQIHSFLQHICQSLNYIIRPNFLWSIDYNLLTLHSCRLNTEQLRKCSRVYCTLFLSLSHSQSQSHRPSFWPSQTSPFRVNPPNLTRSALFYIDSYNI